MLALFPPDRQRHDRIVLSSAWRQPFQPFLLTQTIQFKKTLTSKDIHANDLLQYVYI